MRAISKYPGLVVLIALFAISATSTTYAYEKGFFNRTNCLYAYTEGGNFQFRTSDGKDLQGKLDVGALSYDSEKSKCTSMGKAGKLVFSFDMTKEKEDAKISLVTISMKIFPSPSEGYWEISQANLTITRADVDKRRTFQLEVDDIYAGLEHSFSCSELTLQTVHRKRPTNETVNYEPRATITLRRFQVQPFGELDKIVFAPSFDCSVWFTIPGVMGLVLLFFVSFVTIFGTICLSRIDTNDFKYSKEGLMFTQAQMEANKQH